MATQGGTLRVVSGGALLPTPALTIPASGICTNSERGMLGVAVDPVFLPNRWIFIYYTANTAGGCVNRLSRFVLPDSNVIDPASEVVLIDNMPSTAGNHNAGDVKFGKDGTLFATVGDGGCDYAGDSGCAGANDASRDQQTLTGKLLRINKDGSIPADNPFQGAGTARCNVTGRTTAGNKCQETFAWGFRNPFRFAFDPNAAGNRAFVNDVGQGAWEEIDDVSAGGDYGWNCREGRHANSSTGKCSPTPADMIDPIFEYPHGTIPGTSAGGCASITGGAFVPNGIWPGYDGTYLFADFICGGIFTLAQSGGTWSASDFATGLGGSSAVTVLFGPNGNGQALYYTTYAGGGQVRRVSYLAPGNNPPTAAGSASPRQGNLPLTVNFSLTGSSDPDTGDVLTSFFDFGDGQAVQQAAPTAQHQYPIRGSYTAVLRVRDDRFAFSNPLTFRIYVGIAPPMDFDDDGNSDIIWRNMVTGQNALWLMNGTSLGSIVDLPALPNTSYVIGGVGDFNGDGKPDIVWRNTATGQNAVWLMNGTSVSSIVDLPGLPNTSYVIGGIGDFNGDGNPDVLWRNMVTGQNAVWQMNGTSLSSIVDLPALPNTNYVIGGAGDFDGDGKPDVVWRNSATGQNAIWLMNGTSFSSIVDLPVLPNVNYVIGGIGDLSGDWKPDIVWRNQSTGQNAVWLMNGTSFGSIVDLPILSNITYWMSGPR